MPEREVRDPEKVTVSIEKLATTGEGIARSPLGTGFVAGALAGEEVEAAVEQVHKKIWKGRVTKVLAPSPERSAGPHARCAGCDWGFFADEGAHRAKRALFLETMRRRGLLKSDRFDDLPLTPSPAGYRLRARFHVAGTGRDTALGYYVPRTHRVESAEICEALSQAMRTLLPRLRETLASGSVPVSEISMVEDQNARRRVAQIRLAQDAGRESARSFLEGVRDVFEGSAIVGPRGAYLAASGPPLLWISINGRDYPLATEAFFQANRFLAGTLALDVAEQAGARTGLALDAFGGVGLFAGALLDLGLRVISVESSKTATDLANRAKRRWDIRDDSWTIIPSTVKRWIQFERQDLDVAVLDPPRAGLGVDLAAALAERVRERILYVSCEPATLARDLAAFAERNWHVTKARLYDFFAFTHRVEALVTLERGRA
jgi:tRNA/tmRNA/rRNA uracil-C5-methylase (TrmA/RlmC/RlmD family)